MGFRLHTAYTSAGGKHILLFLQPTPSMRHFRDSERALTGRRARYAGWWFALRVVTLNYLLIGWLLDLAWMKALNLEASKADAKRKKRKAKARKEAMTKEIEKKAALIETIQSTSALPCVGGFSISC